MMYSNNVLNVIVDNFVYILVVLVLSQVHFNLAEKLLSDFEYPEIANLVSWKGENNTYNEDYAFNGNDYYDTEVINQKESLPRDIFHGAGKQVRGFTNNFTNDLPEDYLVAGQEKWDKISVVSTVDPEIFPSRSIGVGPLKFVQEQNIEVDMGLNDNQNNLSPLNDEKTPWGNYYDINNLEKNVTYGKVDSMFDLGEGDLSKGKQKSDNGEVRQFKEPIINTEAPQALDFHSQDGNKNLFNVLKQPVVNLPLQVEHNILIPKQNFEPVQPNSILKNTNFNNISTNQQLSKEENNLSHNLKTENLGYPNTNLEEKVWDVKKYFQCNTDGNVQNTSSLDKLLNNIRGNVNSTDWRNNLNENEDTRTNITDAQRNSDFKQLLDKTINVQKVNNENIVKQALDLTYNNHNIAEHPAVQKQLIKLQLQRLRNEQKMDSLDTSLGRHDSQDNEEMESQQNFTGPKEKYYQQYVNQNLQKYTSSYFDKNKPLNDFNYEPKFNKINNQICGKPAEFTKSKWFNFGNYGNDEKIETIKNNVPGENYFERTKEYLKSVKQQNGYMPKYENSPVNRVQQELPDKSVPVENEVKKDDLLKQWEHRGNNVIVPNINNNTYMDLHAMPNKKSRQGRRHIKTLLSTKPSLSTNNIEQRPNNKLINSGEISNYSASTDLPATVGNNFEAIFSVPTPMTMLPATAVNPTIFNNVSSTTNTGSQQCVKPATPVEKESLSLNLNNKNNNNNNQINSKYNNNNNGLIKIHKAVPNYVNASSNKMNDVVFNTNPLTTHGYFYAPAITPTTFPNKISAEIVSQINEPLEQKKIEYLEKQPHLKPVNNKNNEGIDLNNTYYNNNQIAIPNTMYDRNIKNIRKDFRNNEFENKHIITNNATKNQPNIASNISENILESNQHASIKTSTLNVNKESSRFVQNSNVSSNENQNNQDLLIHNNTVTKNTRSVNKSIRNRMTMAKGKKEEKMNDSPFSQWKDTSFNDDDRNPRGVDCGCFPINDADKSINKYDYSEDEYPYYSIMNRNNPRAVIARFRNNWMARRENKAIQRKDGQSNNRTNNQQNDSDILLFKSKEKEEDNEEESVERDKLDMAMIERNKDYIGGEELLRPMEIDDPELAFVSNHQESPPSKTAQSGTGGEDLEYDDSDSGEQLITRAPVKYVKWHNLTSGAFGGFMNGKHNS